MSARRAPPWRRLAPLAVLVVLAHAGFLVWLQPTDRLQAVRTDVAKFMTRTVAAPMPVASAMPVASVAPVAQEAPAAPLAMAAPPPVSASTPPPPPPAPKAAARPAPARVEARAAAAPPAPSPSPPMAPAAPDGEVAPAAEPVATPTAAAPAAKPLGRASAAPPAAEAAAAVTRVVIPPPARFHYDVAVAAKGFSLRGTGDLEWRHDGRTYEARLEISSPMLPSRIQRSTGRLTAEGLAPAYFLDKSRKEQAAHFDRVKNVVIFSNNQPQADLVAGLQDRLSVLVQLSALVAGQPARFQPGTEIVIPTASTREVEDWTFEVETEENLKLPGGAVRALKLHRQPRKQYDQRLELWLAPRMDYAPVRVRLTNPNGDAVDQRWASTDKG